MTDEIDKVRGFIDCGSEIAGGVAGAAVGMIAGPTGALLGAAAGPIIGKALRKTCVEISERLLGHRERARAGAVAAYAFVAIRERLDNGGSPRNDGFFSVDTDRSDAEEIFEGVLLKGKNEHEEKKLRFFANIFVTATFDDRFTSGTLNRALKTAEGLTYRQLCLLQLFSRPQPLPLRDNDYDGEGFSEMDYETVALVAETFDLFRAGLVKCHDPSRENPWVLIDTGYIHPSWMARTVVGDRLHFLMQLDTLENADLAATAAPLTH